MHSDPYPVKSFLKMQEKRGCGLASSLVDWRTEVFKPVRALARVNQ